MQYVPTWINESWIKQTTNYISIHENYMILKELKCDNCLKHETNGRTIKLVLLLNSFRLIFCILFMYVSLKYSVHWTIGIIINIK